MKQLLVDLDNLQDTKEESNEIRQQISNVIRFLSQSQCEFDADIVLKLSECTDANILKWSLAEADDVGQRASGNTLKLNCAGCACIDAREHQIIASFTNFRTPDKHSPTRHVARTRLKKH